MAAVRADGVRRGAVDVLATEQRVVVPALGGLRGIRQSWRRRVLRPIFAACALAVIGFAVAGDLVSGRARFWLGVLAGATMTLYVAVRDTPPHHIEKWRTGSEGERRTARVLRPLEREGWVVRHDLRRPNGTNIDHVVIGPAGVFLLDTKAYVGQAKVEGGELRVTWREDPEDGWTCRGIVPMRAASAELVEAIRASAGSRVCVQPVVVLWTPLEQKVASVSDVFFIHGAELASWLRGRSPSARPVDVERIGRALDAHPNPPPWPLADSRGAHPGS